jgi:subtilisin family serine protease
MRVDRMSRRTVVAAATALVLAAVAGIPAGSVAAATPAGSPSGTVRSITLVTGDRLTIVDGAGGVAVRPAPGRDDVGFVTRRVGGHLHVVPADAVPLLHAGRLDPRLFDVTALLAAGYDDRRGDLPLIVTYADGVAPVGGARVVRTVPALGAQAVRPDRRSAAAFWAGLAGGAVASGGLRPGVRSVRLDGRLRISLDVSVPLIGAPAAWQAGYTGTGVTVAVLDTGVDDTHPDLAGKIASRRNFTTEDTRDLHGHGTHVASTITGTGAASGGRYRGVAPGARLYDGKVCESSGFCDESAVLAGMQWAAADLHARVVNMSLGQFDSSGLDPLEEAVQNLTARYGTLFVVAAGNNGERGLNSPASADAALAVGAVSKSDELAGFSSRGPRVDDLAVKPDLTAPGVAITAARSKDAVIGTIGERYVTASGTSMATPHVAGAAAILAQRHPDWPAATLKAALMAAARPNPAIGVYGQGAGRVDVARAVGQSVVSDPVSLSFGFREWPHSDDVPATRTVTYHNHGTAPVTLSLALRTADGSGAPTPAGFFTVSPASVTVPAGGDAPVSVTADTRVAGVEGLAGGTLTATGGGVSVQTPLGLENEGERFELKIAHVGRDGKPTTQHETTIFDLDHNFVYESGSGPATEAIRLPRGRYSVTTVVIGDTGGRPALTLLIRPEVRLAGPQALTFDARAGRPVTVTVPNAKARPVMLEAGYVIGDPAIQNGLSIGTAGGRHAIYTAQLGGADRRYPTLVSKVNSQWAVPGPDGTVVDSPAVYLLTWFTEGRLRTGFQRRVTAADLATVRAEYAVHVPGTQAERLAFSNLPGRHELAVSADLRVHLPLRRTEYVNDDGGTRWTNTFIDEVFAGDPPDVTEVISFQHSSPTRYRPGHTYRDRWNRAVFAPGLADRGEPVQWVSRTGDTMDVYVRLHSDSGGHFGDAGALSGETLLFRDGQLAGSVPEAGNWQQFDVPAGDAAYRLVTTGRWLGSPTLSTQVSAAWTFRSGHVAGTAPAVLPLSAIQFVPPVDATNTAPAGRAFAVPIAVSRQAGAGPATVRTLAVEASYDDGATWRSAPVTVSASGGVASLTHPAGAGFVSLRATLTDADANTAELTVIHAYRIA